MITRCLNLIHLQWQRIGKNRRTSARSACTLIMATREATAFLQTKTRTTGKIPVMEIKAALGINAAERIMKRCGKEKTIQTRLEQKVGVVRIVMRINIQKL
jgi:hypothetical protein